MDIAWDCKDEVFLQVTEGLFLDLPLLRGLSSNRGPPYGREYIWAQIEDRVSGGALCPLEDPRALRDLNGLWFL